MTIFIRSQISRIARTIGGSLQPSIAATARSSP